MRLMGGRGVRECASGKALLWGCMISEVDFFFVALLRGVFFVAPLSLVVWVGESGGSGKYGRPPP